MTDPNEEVVKAFLEMKGFFVRTNVRYTVKEGKKASGQSDLDIVALNPNIIQNGENFPFVLEADHFDQISHLVMEIKGWHSEKITKSTLKAHPRIFNFTRKEAKHKAVEILNHRDFISVLVISQIGSKENSKEELFNELKEGGVNHILEFSTIMDYLKVEIKSNLNQDNLVLHSIRLANIYGALSK